MTAVKSTTTSKPASSTVQEAENRGDQPQNVAAQPVSEVGAQSGGTSFIFSVAVTVLAILPIAVGLGVARVNANLAAQTAASEEEQAQHEQSKPRIDFKDRAVGDRYFHERRYELALRYYETMGGEQAERLPPEILYRVALCNEGIGKWDDALNGFRTIVQSSDNPVSIAASRFGQARIHLRLGELRSAVDQLRSIELHADRFAHLPNSLTRDIAFLIPITMAFDAFAPAADSNGTDHLRLGELINWSLEGALAWVDDAELETREEVDATEPTNAMNCRRVLAAGLKEIPKATIGEYVDASFKNQSLKSVVECVAKACDWTVDWTDLANQPSINGEINFEWANCPVSFLLTSCASELQSSWRLEEDRLIFQHADPKRRHWHAMIQTTLNQISKWIPSHRLVDHATYASAQLLEQDGQQNEAISLFASLVGHDASPLTIQAAYDSALLYYRQKNYSKACFHLGYVVNGAPGHPLHTDALILLGRLYLDRGESQEAVFQLRRATETHSRSINQARAAALLGVAYLVQDKYAEAAQVIFDNRIYFEDQEARVVASFVNAYGRWQIVSGELQKREASFLYRSLIAINTDAEWIGQMTKVIIGRAFSELGFDDKMAQLYWQLSFEGVTPQLEPEILYSLANYEFNHEGGEAAVLKWSKLAESGTPKWASRSRMRLAEIALSEGRGEDCLNQSEAIKDFDGIIRTDLSRLMGQAYELLGDDTMAAKCYAGLLP